MKKLFPSLILITLLYSCTFKTKRIDIDLALIPFKSAEYWGYFDQSGKTIINPQFSQAYIFSEDLALICSSDKKYGYINKKGEIVIPPIYKYACKFSEGLAAIVKEDGKIEYIDPKGEVKITLSEEIEEAGSFHESLALAVSNDLYGFIDKTGKIVIPIQFRRAENFSEGLAKVLSTDNTNQYGYIDKEGKLKISYQFKECEGFSEGMACISTGKQYGYIDNEGKYLINPQFDYASNFQDGKAIVRQGELYGFIDKNGKYIINPQFKGADLFSDGLAAVVSTNFKYGYIDPDGKFVVNPQYEYSSRFFNGKAIARLGDRFGIINTDGKFVVNPQFETVTISDGYNSFVKSDYFEANTITKAIISGSSALAFKGASATSTFKTLKEIYPALSQNNYYQFSQIPNNTTKYFKLDRIDFAFTDGLLTPQDVYQTQDQYDALSGGYVKRQVYQTTNYILNESTKINHITYRYILYGKAFAKKDAIIQDIVSTLSTELKMTKIGPTTLKSNAFDIAISTTENENIFYIIVDYNNQQAGGADTTTSDYN